MSQNMMIVIVVIVVMVAFIAILFMRSGKGSLSIPGITASVETDKPGATIRDNRVEGRGNEMAASGDGALIAGNEAKGDDNKFTAS